MFTVTYTYFKKTRREVPFKTYNAARRFFYEVIKEEGVTRPQILSTSIKKPSMNAKLFA